MGIGPDVEVAAFLVSAVSQRDEKRNTLNFMMMFVMRMVCNYAMEYFMSRISFASTSSYNCTSRKTAQAPLAPCIRQKLGFDHESKSEAWDGHESNLKHGEHGQRCNDRPDEVRSSLTVCLLMH